MKSNYKRLGDYIRQVDVRNRDLVVNKLLGLSISKQFIPSIANTIGTDMANYKIVQPRQFGYVPVTSRNGDKITVALYEGQKPCIISQAYIVFEVTDTDKLLPEYLMMWFRRPEFDRYSRFKSHGSAREVFEWEEMCEVMLPVPPIEEQRKIVAEYQAVERRIENNRRLIATLEASAQTIYRKMFVDNIDPNNLPEGWRIGKLSDIVDYVNEKVNSHESNCYISTENMLKDFGGVAFADDVPEEIRGTKFKKGDILLSNIRPYFRKLWLSDRDGCCSNDVLCFRSNNSLLKDLPFYIMSNNQFFDYVMAGANGVKMPRGDKEWIMNYSVPIPNEISLMQFSEKVKRIKGYRSLLDSEEHVLNNLKDILLSKLSNL